MPRALLLALTVVLASSLATSSAIAQPATQDAQPVVVNNRITLDTAELHIPMDHTSGHIVIATMVNGEGPYRFQLDTGAGLEACIDVKLAEKLKLTKTGTVLNSAGNIENAVTRDLVRIDELSFGGATIKNVRALAADYSWISDDKNDPVMGLLGFQLFRELLLTIDYPADEVILRKGNLKGETGDEILTFNASSGSPYITLRIGDEKLRTLIDTGAKGTIVLTEKDLERIKIDGELVQSGKARTVNEEFPVFKAVLAEDLVLGTRSFPKVTAGVFKPFQYSILGHKLLSEFVITFDQQNSRVRFAEAKPQS